MSYGESYDFNKITPKKFWDYVPPQMIYRLSGGVDSNHIVRYRMIGAVWGIIFTIRREDVN